MKNQLADTWVCMLPSKYLYENYDLDTADRLKRECVYIQYSLAVWHGAGK